MRYMTNIKVRYNETDQMGVVYHGNYFTWFDIGRTGFLGSIGLPYDQLEDDGVLLPVIEANCKYKKPAKYGDELIIIAELAKLKGIRIQFDYEIYRKKDNTLLAEGYTLHAFVDKELKPMNIKKKHNNVWKLLKENS